MKLKKLASCFVMVTLMMLAILVFLGPKPLIAGYALFCKDAFPGTCTQGGCDAESGWHASGCELTCSSRLKVACQVPQG